MNIEAYNLDSLRKLIRDLQTENKELRMLLDEAQIPYINSTVFSEIPSESLAYDLDQGMRILSQPVKSGTWKRSECISLVKWNQYAYYR